jgi:hypothetical protein
MPDDPQCPFCGGRIRTETRTKYGKQRIDTFCRNPGCGRRIMPADYRDKVRTDRES